MENPQRGWLWETSRSCLSVTSLATNRKLHTCPIPKMSPLLFKGRFPSVPQGRIGCLFLYQPFRSILLHTCLPLALGFSWQVILTDFFLIPSAHLIIVKKNQGSCNSLVISYGRVFTSQTLANATSTPVCHLSNIDDGGAMDKYKGME